MATEDDAKLIREHLDVVHRLHVELAEAVLRVADETGIPPVELSQFVSMGGGGLHTVLYPLIHKQQQAMMRQHMRAQRVEDEDPDDAEAP